MVLVLVWLAIFYESNKYLETERHDFRLIPLKKVQVRFELLNLDKESKEQFIRLIEGSWVRKKINFTMGNKGGESANHRILFVLFDELIVGGIQDLTGERKRSFLYYYFWSQSYLPLSQGRWIFFQKVKSPNCYFLFIKSIRIF